MTCVRPPCIYIRSTAVHDGSTIGANWNPPQICYFCEGFVILALRFVVPAQICSDLPKFVIPTKIWPLQRAGSRQVVKHKGDQFAQVKKGDWLPQIKGSEIFFEIIEAFQHLPSYFKFHFQISKKATVFLDQTKLK